MEFKIGPKPVHPEPDLPEDEDLDPVTKAQKLLAEWENEEPVTLTHKLIKALSASKLSANQGAQNAGKVLTVGLDGIVVPAETDSGVVVATLTAEEPEEGAEESETRWVLDKSFDELYEAPLSIVVDPDLALVFLPREVGDYEIRYHAIGLKGVNSQIIRAPSFPPMIDSFELVVNSEDEVSLYEKTVYGSNTPLVAETWTFELASGQTVTKSIVTKS